MWCFDVLSVGALTVNQENIVKLKAGCEIESPVIGHNTKWEPKCKNIALVIKKHIAMYFNGLII